jgi:putative transcriptional regulator
MAAVILSTVSMMLHRVDRSLPFDSTLSRFLMVMCAWVAGSVYAARKVSRMRNLVRELRATKGLSQAALGEALGVSRQTRNSIEVGKYDPPLPFAFKIARLFRTPVEAVFLMDNETSAATQEPTGPRGHSATTS